jgi:hypothetical protein
LFVCIFWTDHSLEQPPGLPTFGEVWNLQPSHWIAESAQKCGRGLNAVDNTNVCSGAFEVRLSGVQWRSDATLCSGSPRRLGPSIDLTCMAAGWLDLFLFVGGFNDLCGESVRAKSHLSLIMSTVYPGSLPRRYQAIDRRPPPRYSEPCTYALFVVRPPCFITPPSFATVSWRVHKLVVRAHAALAIRAWRGFFLAPDPHRQLAGRTRPRLGHLHP